MGDSIKIGGEPFLKNKLAPQAGEPLRYRGSNFLLRSTRKDML